MLAEGIEASGSGVWCIPGSVIDDRYVLVRELGRGGMGVVYEAVRRDLGLPVALKFLRPDRLDQAHDRSMDREVLCSSALRHENIVQLLDVGLSQKGPYAAFELISGSTLSDVLDEGGALDLPRAVGIMQQVGRALCCAHASGVIHRDLKASNVMLTKHADGRDLIKVLDFGIARLPQSDGATPTDGPAGTAAYMAPEVARGESRGDAPSDVYSMGVLLYELLSAHRPHEGTSLNAILHSVMTKPPAPLENYRPDLPDCLRDLVQRTISPDPKDRPQTAASFFAELTAIAGTLSEAAAKKASVPPLPLPSPSSSSSPFRSAVLGVIGGALGAGVIFAATSQHETRDQGASAPLAATQAPPQASGDDERRTPSNDGSSSPGSPHSDGTTPQGPSGSLFSEHPAGPPLSSAGDERAAPPPPINDAKKEHPKRSIALPQSPQRLVSNLEPVSVAPAEKTPEGVDEITGFVLRNPYE